MRMRLTLIALMLTVFTVRVAQAEIAAVPQQMNFQGRLAKPDGSSVPDGTYSVRFSLWTAQSGGTEKWNQTLNLVAVRNGVFAVQLNTSTGAADKFNSNLFLEIKVGNDPALTPRQQLTSSAYAFKADSVRDGAITGASIANATITANKFAANIFNPLAWLLGGNSGITSGFLGTTDNQPLVFKVNNRRAMQYTYAENTADPGNEFRAINVLGGSEINSIAPGVMGATIVGGGQDYFTGTDFPNTITADFGTVVGGALNTANGFAFVGGGYNNKATEFYSTIAGGTFNTASNNQTFIGGGILNTASGFGATVPGGSQNEANGNFSFAAGNNAHALQNGTFVWSDNSSNDAFASTGSNQFLIKAAGGVGINTNTPGFPLTFADTNGDKISLSGQSGNHFGFGIAPDTLQIHTAGQFNNIDFGYGQNSAFFLTARSYGNGDFVAVRDCYAQGFFLRSDARYKQGIVPLENALDKISNLRGVTFEWDREKWKDKRFGEGRQVGFIAQEVEKVLPELVHTDETGYKSVAYANIVPVLVEAVKQQQKQIEELKIRLKQQDVQLTQIEALKRRLDTLQAQR